MRVLAHVERAVGALSAAVIADRLGDGQNVGFRECAAQRRPPVAARAEIQKETEIAKALVHSEASTLAQEIIRAILGTRTAAKEPAVGGRR